MNSVSLVGRLTAPPTLEETTGETPVAVAKFRLAVDRRRAKDGTERDPVFVDVVAYGGQAAPIAEHCGKGRSVAVTGRLEHETWQAEDGTGRQKHLVIASSVDFLAKPRETAVPDDDAKAA